MIKAIPNMITSLRIIGTIVLLFLEPFSVPFYIVYTVAGVSDAVDGWVARTFHLTSDFGTKLDSIADLLFYAVMLIRILPVLWVMLPFYIWFGVAAVLLTRVAAYVVAACKYRRFAAVHTYLNKLTGAAVFLTPYFLMTFIGVGYCFFVTVVGFLSSLEELCIHAMAKEYDEHKKSVFMK